MCCVTGISDNSLNAIIQHLNLEEVDLTLNLHQVTFEKIQELKSMSKLRILNCKQFENSEIETFREVLSHENSEIIINRNDLNIANPELGKPEEGFFEIECERLVMLKDHLDIPYII